MCYNLKSHQNFFDQQMLTNPETYYRERIDMLMRERYLIAKQLNTSFIETNEMTPKEREYMIKLFLEERDKLKEMHESNR